MTPREEFEAVYSRHQSSMTGRPVTAEDIAAQRDGDSYGRGATYLNGVYSGWLLARQCLVIYLPDARVHSQDRCDEFREDILAEVSAALFEQGLNNAPAP